VLGVSKKKKSVLGTRLGTRWSSSVAPSYIVLTHLICVWFSLRMIFLLHLQMKIDPTCMRD